MPSASRGCDATRLATSPASAALSAAQLLADRLRDELLHRTALLDADQAHAPLEFARDTGVEADEWPTVLAAVAGGGETSLAGLLPGAASHATRVAA